MSALLLLGVAWLALAAAWSARAARRRTAERRSVERFRWQEEMLAQVSTRCAELGADGNIGGIAERVDEGELPEPTPVLDAEPKLGPAPARQRRSVRLGRLRPADWQGSAA